MCQPLCQSLNLPVLFLELVQQHHVQLFIQYCPGLACFVILFSASNLLQEPRSGGSRDSAQATSFRDIYKTYVLARRVSSDKEGQTGATSDTRVPSFKMLAGANEFSDGFSQEGLVRPALDFLSAPRRPTSCDMDLCPAVRLLAMGHFSAYREGNGLGTSYRWNIV